MTDKPKRKNDEHIPRRYWWFFGILAILLLIGLRFPVRLTASIQVNLALYGIAILVCLVAMVRFIPTFHWKTVTAIFLLILLAGTNISQILRRYSYDYDVYCTSHLNGIIETYECVYGGACIEVHTEYIGIRTIPVLIETNAHGRGFMDCAAVPEKAN